MNSAALSHNLSRELRRRLRTARLRFLVHGLIAWLATGGGAVVLAIITLAGREPPSWMRWGLAAATLLAVLVGGWVFVAKPLRRLRSATALVRQLEAQGRYANTLTAAEEALRVPERWHRDDPVRAELVRRLLLRARSTVAGLDLPRLLPLWRPGAALLVAVAVAALAVWQQERDPAAWFRGWDRLTRPWQTSLGSPEIGLYLVTGETHAVAGDSVVLAALDFGTGPQNAVCEIRTGSGAWRPVPAYAQKDGAPVDPVIGPPYRRWETRVDDVREDFAYRFRRGARQTVACEVTVWHPPLLSRLAAEVRPPAYTGVPPTRLARLPAFLEIPVGSRVEFTGLASERLLAAALVTEAGDTLDLEARADSLSGRVEVTERLRFHVELTDVRQLRNRERLAYSLAVIPDREPVAVLERPEDDGRLPVTAPLRLEISARDDYGLSGMDILLRRADGSDADGGAWIADLPGGGRLAHADRLDEDCWEHVPLWSRPAALDRPDSLGAAVRRLATHLGPLRLAKRSVPGVDGRRELALGLTLHAGDLALVPGDVLELMIEARDNREPGPRGVGRSAVLRLEVPSTMDLLQARIEEEQGHRADLEEARRRSTSLGQDLQRLRRELMKNPVPDWEKTQELEAAFERQAALHQELSRLAEALQQDLENLAADQLTSQELMEKMDQVAELLRDVATPEMEALLERMREAMDQLSPEEVAAAVEEMARNQQEMVRRLDTALAMLKDLAREQELEGMTSLLAQMIRKQQELADAAREAAKDEQSGGEEGDEEGQEADSEEDDAGDDDGGENEEGESSSQDEGNDSEGEQSPEGSESAESGDEGEPESETGTSDDADADQPSNEELARRQEALAEELAGLEERLQEALDNLRREQEESGESSDASEEMEQALEEALKQMQEEQTQQGMQQSGEQLEQNQPGDAAQQMQQSLQELAGLYHVLLRSQMAMEMAMQQQQAATLHQLASDLLALSERQEQIHLDLPAEIRDVRTGSLARDQHRVLQATFGVRDGLAEIAAAAPQEIMRLLNKIDDLISELGRAVDHMEAGRGGLARSATRSGLAEMNRIVIGLLTQAQNVGGGGGASCSMPQLSQQLQQMSKDQAGLNGLAEQLRRRQQGGLSEALRSQMQRLGESQGDIAARARELAELEREAPPEGGRILGDMDELARMMERVGDDVGQGLITEETLLRQERILSRLLDAQNAARERDWARRRESRTAEDLFTQQEGRERGEVDEDEAAARRFEPVEKAPPAYRDLVRRYFRSLQDLHGETGRTSDGRRREETPAGDVGGHRGGTP